MNYKSFKTDRLILKPITTDDAQFIFRLLNTPSWLANIGDRNVKSETDAFAYIQKNMISQRERLGFSTFTLIRKEDQVKIGVCGLYDREGIDGIDIGFALLPQYEQKGYAFESVSKLMEIAFEEFGIKSISAITNKENYPSQKLLEKIGLRRKGVIKLPNDDKELLFFNINLPV